ncbi:MAG: hypothetical protein ACMUHX_05230, partial [bacterium]
YSYSPERCLYSAYFFRNNQTLQYEQLDLIYDYTDEQYEWYSLAMAEGSRWSEPYFCEAGITLMTTYSSVFYETDQETKERVSKGVVTIDISMDEIGRIVKSLDLGPSGFGALISKKGFYLYHPNTEYVTGKKTILDLAEEYNDKSRRALGERLLKSEKISGIMDHISTTTGLSSWLAFESIPSTGWCLQNTFIKNDLEFDKDTLRRQLIRTNVFTLLFLISFSLLFFSIYKGSESKLWWASGILSFLFIAGIGILWYLALSYNSPGTEKGITILDKTSLEKIQKDYIQRSHERHIEPPVYIPTGILIDSVRFADSDNVIMAGYIWQRFDRRMPEDFSREFTIPSAEDVKISKICCQEVNGAEIIRWHFQAKVRQSLDHSKYPIDLENLGVRIVNKDLNHNIVLVPDLSSYSLINPTSLPGLEKGLSVSGWKTIKSFFELVNKGYYANFGGTQSIMCQNFPELRFNILIKRNFIDSFISNLTPLIVVLFMLFSILMTSTSDKIFVEKMKTGPGMVLSLCSALFFVVVFSHIGIRQRIMAEEIFYLEYFYFVIYLTILLTSVISIVFAKGKRLLFLHYKENLVSKLLFWPVILGSLFVITLITFY